MDLKTFVTETLKEIVDGVKEANAAGVLTMGKVRPQAIEFDVAVTTVEGTDKKGGVGLVVAGFGLGGQLATANSNSTVSRIKFSVPVILPDKQQ